jgi:uncharacterized protein with GYD domain
MGPERRSPRRCEVWPLLPVIRDGPAAAAGVEAAGRGAILTGKARSDLRLCTLGVVAVAKYLVLFGCTGQTMKRFVAKPSDRAAVVRELAESVGGSLESYYWMFGQYDGVGVFGMPDSRSMAAVSLAAASSGAFTHFETHELIEASDLSAIAEQAEAIAYPPPGA